MNTYSIVLYFGDDLHDKNTTISGLTRDEAYSYAVKCMTKEINVEFFTGEQVNIYIKKWNGQTVATYYP